LPADNDEIVVGANGKILVAAVGTTAPTDVTTAWAAAWWDLGYATDDGVTLTDSKTINGKAAWQSFYPVRRIVTARDFQAKFTLIQWNMATIEFAYGGGQISSLGGGVYRFTPPSPEVIDERALGVEWVDGIKIYRLVIPHGLLVEATETKIARTDSANLPLTFGVIGEAGVDPWYLLSNDPSLSVS
jgi:hypothetical protein